MGNKNCQSAAGTTTTDKRPPQSEGPKKKTLLTKRKAGSAKKESPKAKQEVNNSLVEKCPVDHAKPSANSAPTAAASNGGKASEERSEKKIRKKEVQIDDSNSARPSLPVQKDSGPASPRLQNGRKLQSATSMTQELRSSIAEENANKALSELRVYQVKPLSDADKVLVMQGWNKCLAFKTAFSESLLMYWRLLCHGAQDENGQSQEKMDLDLNAMAAVEKNKDPLYTCFGTRLADAEELLMGVLDGAIRSLCPRTQVVQREAYRAMMDESILQRHRSEFTLECESMQEHFDLFARLGVEPKFWSLFVEAVRWAMKTHAPYAQTDDFDDLERASAESAWGRVIALQVAIPAIETRKALSTLYRAPVVGHLQTIWGRLSASDQADFGENFYRKLLSRHPDLLDFFSRTDMDALAVHLALLLDLVIKNVHSLGVNIGAFRGTLDHLAEIHRRMNIPTYSYALVGGTILDCFQPIFEAEQEDTKDSDDPVSAKDLRSALTKVYSEIMSILYYPMLRQEKFIAAAKEFYEQVKVELEWSESKFERRLLEIEEEIASTGFYTQTTAEVEMGARLAWRNSAKCIGESALLDVLYFGP
jgi:hemoglobin-like flavoprotein